jgi:ribose transport system permease protein
MNKASSAKAPSLLQEKTKPILLVYLILLVILVVAQLISPGFVSFDHMETVIRQSAFLGIVAIGQTFVILTGGIDLSVASVISISNIVAAQVMSGSDQNVGTAMVFVILIGLVTGLANGCCIYYLKIPPMVMTLAMGSVVEGIALIYSKGAPKGNTAPFVQFLGTGRIGGVLSPLILIWIVLSALTILVLKKGIFGRNTYLVGTNVLSSSYSGVNIAKQIISVYVISGMMAALTGILLVGYTNTSFINAGDIYSMNSIAAVVMGGTSIMGGYGGYVGTIAGSIIMTVIVSLLTILHMPVSGRDIIQGLIIISLVLVYGRQMLKNR